MTILQPINDNIVIKLPEVEKEQKTTSGIVLAQSGQGQVKPDRGVIVAVGSGRVTADGTLIELNVQAGDYVIFNRFAGTELLVEEDRYLIVKECDILAKIK